MVIDDDYEENEEEKNHGHIDNILDYAAGIMERNEIIQLYY